MPSVVLSGPNTFTLLGIIYSPRYMPWNIAGCHWHGYLSQSRLHFIKVTRLDQRQSGLSAYKLCWLSLQIYTQCGAVITRLISHKYSQNIPYSSPVRARYVVSFLNPASHWYCASVPVIIYVISYNFGLRYNGTRLYIKTIYIPTSLCTRHMKNIMFL